MQPGKTLLQLFAGFIFLGFLTGIDGFSQTPVNKFSDPVIRDIYDKADRRDTLALLPYLRDPNPNYRGEALMCLASVQAPGLIDSIAPAINAEQDGIRMAAAFALGQTYHLSAVPLLMSALEKEEGQLVKGMLYDALGKTGELENLRWLAGQETEYQESEGQAQGILRFALRGMSSAEANYRMMKIIEKGTSTVGAGSASYYLGRYADSEWLNNFSDSLQLLFLGERDPVVRSNLVMAIIKARGEGAWPLVEEMLISDEDYRVKVNSIRSIGRELWEQSSRVLYEYALGEDAMLAVTASEAIERNAGEGDLKHHLKAVKKSKNRRARALLMGKALEMASGDDKLTGRLTSRAEALYHATDDDMEKAWLLKSFAAVPLQYSFVEQEMKKGLSQAISTYAMETLTLMRQSSSFERSADVMLLQDIDLDDEFLRIFKEGVRSGDLAMVSLSASVLRDPGLNYRDLIKNTGFIEEALDAATSPEMAEARVELIAALEYFSGRESDIDGKPRYNHPINWERVMQIPPRQLIGIITGKGEIIVQLNVNRCPGTVSAFLELAGSGFYNNRRIHRLVPNFVVQDGCPRGDGWGGPPFTIRSEFTPSPFVAGVFGMASAGKDTEGSQWYITHTATPHLEGKYTNFGFVVSGMEVVHSLEAGDLIEKIVIISN